MAAVYTKVGETFENICGGKPTVRTQFRERYWFTLELQQNNIWAFIVKTNHLIIP